VLYCVVHFICLPAAPVVVHSSLYCKIRYMFVDNCISTGVQVLQCGSYRTTATRSRCLLGCYSAAAMQLFSFTIFVGRICLLLRCMTVFYMFLCSIICTLLGSRPSFSFCYFLRSELCSCLLRTLNSSSIPILIILTLLMKPLIM
jgi:hypothetical protein